MTGSIHLIILALSVLMLAAPRLAAARTLYRSLDGTFSTRLTGYVKTLVLGLDTSLPNTGDTVEDFTRARLMLEGDLGTLLRWTVHYEHFGVINPASEATTGFFAGDRATGTQTSSVLPLDWTVKKTGSLVWRHELDRLNLHFTLPQADIMIGRQAISWGVGRFWNPSDLFVAFSPVEIDREFKAGVDAVRLKVPLGAFSQVEAVYAAFDDDFRRHSIGMRGHLTVRDFDLGLMGGKFFRDVVTGAFFDGEVKGAGVRGEFTFTHNTTEVRQERRTFVRGVSSLDYRLANGLYGLLEYYFNGFGQSDPKDYPRLFTADRLARGEIFNLGRHYLGGLLEYEAHPLVHTSLFGQWNLLDQSGLIGPLLTVSLSDEADLRLGAYFPFGADPVGSRLRSEFGLYPRVYYLQLQWYF